MTKSDTLALYFLSQYSLDLLLFPQPDQGFLPFPAIVMRLHDMYPAFICNPYRNFFFRYRPRHTIFLLLERGLTFPRARSELLSLPPGFPFSRP